MGAVGRGKADRSGVFDDPVGPSLAKMLVAFRGLKRNHPATGGFAGANAGRSIFENDAILWSEAEEFCPAQVGLRVRLGVADIGRGDHFRGSGKAGYAQPHQSQSAGARSDDGPAIGRKRAQEFGGAGKGDNALDILDFHAFDHGVFGGVIGVREKFADGRETGTAMGTTHGLLRIETVLPCPDGPHAGHRGRGVDKHAIKIEEDTLAVNPGHAR